MCFLAESDDVEYCVIVVFCLLKLEDTLWAGLTDLHIKTPMGITAENLAEKYQITREDCDQYAYQTQQKWKAGQYVLITFFHYAAFFYTR